MSWIGLVLDSLEPIWVLDSLEPIWTHVRPNEWTENISFGLRGKSLAIKFADFNYTPQNPYRYTPNGYIGLPLQ